MVDPPLSSFDLPIVKLEHVVHLAPALVTSDSKLRIRKQQGKNKTTASKALLPHLRKVEKAAGQILFLKRPQGQLPPANTQAEIHTRLLKLPKSEGSISIQEHNDIDGYE